MGSVRMGFRSPIWIRGILKSAAFSALRARKLAELAKPDELSEVVCGQRLTTNFVVSSGLAKLSRLNFLIPGSLVRVQPGVLAFSLFLARPGRAFLGHLLGFGPGRPCSLHARRHPQRGPPADDPSPRPAAVGPGTRDGGRRRRPRGRDTRATAQAGPGQKPGPDRLKKSP